MIKSRTAILALLTGLNFINYLDRFIVAAVLPRIMSELGLSNLEGGLLSTVFLLGYFVTSPMFGSLGDRMSRKKLITFGVLCWSLATFASGLAGGIATMLIARVFVGVGEASYATLAPTIIDDIAPPEKKGSMLAVFFLAVPVGSALGFILGGIIQHRWGWRAAFFVGGGPGIVLALTCLLIDEPVRTHVSDAKQKMKDVIFKLMRIKLYARAVWGYCAHTAAIGAFAFWGPKFLSAEFSRSFVPDASKLPEVVAALHAKGVFAAVDEVAGAALHKSDFLFGSITVVAGFIGTIIGGILCDRALRGLPPVPPNADHENRANKLAANAQLRVCAIGVAVAVPMTAIAFFAPNATMFFAFAGLAEVGLFMSASPINAIMLRTAPPWLRASAMAVGIFAIHLFGDLWSPPALGVLLDVLDAHFAMLLLSLTFGVAAFVWWPRAREAA
ncbi:MAG TPA: MFS transporter [Kofleriaceae bacterium]|jgi:MFS family permease